MMKCGAALPRHYQPRRLSSSLRRGHIQTLQFFGKLNCWQNLPENGSDRLVLKQSQESSMSSATTTHVLDLQNYVGGGWHRSAATEYVDVLNPATAEVLARTPLSTNADVDAAVRAAADAFPAWRRTPPGERVRYLFTLRNLLVEHIDEISKLITRENGKTFAEARAEMQRGIENVEVACGIPMMMQGYNLEDVTPGVDEMQIRQPLGVVAAIVPFNFPGMIAFWFLPYAIACGNTFILKPSERVPLTSRYIMELIQRTGLPKGVVNLVNGGRTVVDALCDHLQVRAVSFVGSTPVAKHVYARAAASGKRMQCQGGAKNHVVVLPDADMELATQIISDSAFGCAGQRCLAVSVAVTIGEAQKTFGESIADAASKIKIGNGLDAGVQMGPVITQESKQRIETLIGQGIGEGAKATVDGRNAKVPNHDGGNFVKPTVLDGLPLSSSLAHTEIFGPVLSLVHADSIDDAMTFLANSPYGNQASLFTTSGAAARKFRYEAPAGNIGINIGVAAPMAYFPFSGWKESFFGILHGQGRDAVEFYTESKIVVERWSRQETRKF
jgi:malonate-semialdehyde dehydrogenase (acetylating) / methylmalonate-semialdehyde dehydrogenase